MTKERNPLDWYSLTESANSILNGLIALSSRMRRQEMEKADPDRDIVVDLKRLSEEVWAINNDSRNFTSLERMEDVINKYGPVMLAAREKNTPPACTDKSLDELKERYRLPQQQYKNIFADILTEYTKNLKPAGKPVAVIIGGQPGSGKIELEKIARIELEENVMVCNPNNLRDFHPDADSIKVCYEEFYPDITAEYAQSWKNDLIAYCVDSRLNFIAETTFASGHAINRIIRELKDKDYLVEIKLMAVHPQLSFMLSQLRYEEMKVREGAGRVVTKAIHDDRYSKLITTLLLV